MQTKTKMTSIKAEQLDLETSNSEKERTIVRLKRELDNLKAMPNLPTSENATASLSSQPNSFGTPLRSTRSLRSGEGFCTPRSQRITSQLAAALKDKEELAREMSLLRAQLEASETAKTEAENRVTQLVAMQTPTGFKATGAKKSAKVIRPQKRSQDESNDHPSRTCVPLHSR